MRNDMIGHSPLVQIPDSNFQVPHKDQLHASLLQIKIPCLDVCALMYYRDILVDIIPSLRC
jgi:hypothetical protein